MVMEVVKSNFLTKSNRTINEAVRNTSCSRGWLRVTVQTIFGIITVTSFVLIVLMAVSRPPPKSTKSTACFVTNCRIHCGQTTYNTEFENEIISSVLDTGLPCDRLILIIQNVQFKNATLPSNLFTRLSSSVERLYIVGGNLRHIPPNVFLGQFGGGLKALTFEQVTISSWTTETLVGLRSLETLTIKDTMIVDIGRHVMSAVDETVQSVTMTNNGQWNPVLITGSTDLVRLENVDFSHNYFGNITTARTFRGIRFCKVLYLNSCKITALPAGAFNSLKNLETLYLNDNYLVTLPVGLFSIFLNMENPQIRIHLQDNLWDCNCSEEELILVSKRGLLIVDPVCYYPNDVEGMPVTDLVEKCTNVKDDVEIVLKTEKILGNDTFGSFNGPCLSSNYSALNSPLKIFSPVPRYNCLLDNLRSFERVSQWQYGITKSNSVKTKRLKLTFILQNNRLSMMEIHSSAADDYGLIWAKSACPNEIHCINVMPSFLRVYNFLLDTTYTFCPMRLATGEVDVHSCVFYNTSLANTKLIKKPASRPAPLFYLATAILCLLLGAICVYGVIRNNPTLLRGSKRILFVKHRNVDALVLPPKVPLRSSLMGDEQIDMIPEKVFTVANNDKLQPKHFKRSNSVRSDKSSTPTYISAMQPTELQLAEWRLRNHFDKNDSIISISSDMSGVFWICDKYEAEGTKIPYESLK